MVGFHESVAWEDRPVLFGLQDVCVARGGGTVLDHVTAEIPAGATAITGPSGAGKSTLLRLLNRLADPDSGTVSLRGADVRSRDVLGLRREVGLVPQLPAPFPGTVAENLRYGPALCGREAGVDCDRLLGLAGLRPEFAGREASRLSVGEQQRVMLARALALEPSVLLLDEPTSALDQTARDAVEAALGTMRSELGISIVIVTHDPAQAARLADRVLRLEAGRLA
jgi:putative ABC transport system ATP-binding protein